MISTRSIIAMAHPALRRATIPGRGFCLSTSSRLGLKETSTQTDVDYDRHKRDSLSKQKRGTGHWKPELATDSEEAVKADRLPKEDAAAMQERTKRSAEERMKSGTSMSDGM